MHDVGMNMSQLAMSVKQVDNTIELARSWSHDLLHATETYDMERIGSINRHEPFYKVTPESLKRLAETKCNFEE